MNRTSFARLVRVMLVCAVWVSLVPATASAETEPTVPAGVVIGATDLSGLPASQARIAIEQTVRAAAGRALVVRAAGRNFTFNPASSLQIDVDGMLATALAGGPPPADPSSVTTFSVPASYTVNTVAMNAFLASVRKTIYRAPKNAWPYVSSGRIRVSPSRYGITLNIAASRTRMLAALAPRSAFATRTVTALSVASIKPKVLTSQVGKTILVDRSARTLKLFTGARLLRSYRCAVGMRAYPTPLGRWKVVSRQFMPSWYNPGSAWAAGMPNYIGPGPSNPLGTRALALNASGVLIHGTTKDYSIGTAASHGCMRMHRWDIEALYPLVPVGTRVWIIP